MEISGSAGTLLVFAWSATGLFALLEGLYLARSNRRAQARSDHARDRMRRHASRIRTREKRDSASILLESSERGPILQYLTSLIPDRRPLDLWLYRAGAPMPLEVFTGLTVAMTLGSMSIGAFATGVPAAALLFMFFGLIPTFHIRRLEKKRMQAFETEFPNAIDLLGRLLRAGHPLSTALQIMSEECSEPVSTEMTQVVEEIGLGLDTRMSLENLRTRLGTQEVSFFVNAVLIQRETGGDLPRVLDALAHQTRERVNFRSKVGVLVAQTSASANVLAMFPLIFAGLISFVAPGYLNPMIESPNGRLALYVAAGLTVGGWWISRRIAVIKI